MEKKKEWKNERKLIIEQNGGKIPDEILEQDKMRKQIDDVKNKNTALRTSLNIIEAHLRKELNKLESQLKIQKDITNQTHDHNNELSKKILELKNEREYLENELKKEKEKENNNNNNNNNKENEYPPESTVIQNLLQAQVEFYFSDYNLKRDKRLLQDVVKPPKGYLTIKDVMQLSRIRQLCSDSDQLIDALKRSKILELRNGKLKELKKNEILNEAENSDGTNNQKKEEELKEKENLLIGRKNFEKPREKEFPFRRTVFIFGIPENGDEKFLKEMLQPFGQISKIQFDSGIDSLDRQIGIRFLSKPRVYTLFRPKNIEILINHQSIDSNKNKNLLRKTLPAGSYQLDFINNLNPIKMEFRTKHKLENREIQCHKCNKQKPVNEGFYTSNEWKKIYCSQCSAQLAEEQLNQYYKDRPQPKKIWLGDIPNDINKRKTALVVFASQRQASKCAYVRTRISYKGAFATHFHHYSKIKKEISNTDNNETNNNSRNLRNNTNYKKQYFQQGKRNYVGQMGMASGFTRHPSAPVKNMMYSTNANRKNYRKQKMGLNPIPAANPPIMNQPMRVVNNKTDKYPVFIRQKSEPIMHQNK